MAEFEAFDGPCSECGAKGDVLEVAAVKIGHTDRIRPCLACLDKLIKGEIRPETKRILAVGAGWQMLQILKPGQEPDKPTENIDIAAAGLILELKFMVENDPDKGTENETAFFRGTRPRTREIGQRLYENGGHNLMLRAYYDIRKAYGPSARSLEINWSGIGEWFD